MHKILGVRFREVGKITYFIYQGKENIEKDDIIVAETRLGVECGVVAVICDTEAFKGNVTSTEKIIRKATVADLKSLKEKEKEEKEAEKICKKKILEHKLKMKLIDVEYMFNRNKIVFYFVSESRVDFRNLVKDLAHVFRVRIELRQVGIRDEAKILGGLGLCGRPLCCTTFLKDFQPVSIKMAKDQGMSLNPSKLSGTCGRLMCCLKYEQENYRNTINKMPTMNSKVSTPEGEGTVVGYAVLKSQVKVAFDNDTGNSVIKLFGLQEVKLL